MSEQRKLTAEERVRWVAIGTDGQLFVHSIDAIRTAKEHADAAVAEVAEELDEARAKLAETEAILDLRTVERDQARQTVNEISSATSFIYDRIAERDGAQRAAWAADREALCRQIELLRGQIQELERERDGARAELIALRERIQDILFLQPCDCDTDCVDNPSCPVEDRCTGCQVEAALAAADGGEGL